MSGDELNDVDLLKIEPTDFRELQDFLRFENLKHQRMVKLSEALDRIAGVIQHRRDLERLMNAAAEELEEVRARLAEEQANVEAAREQAKDIITNANAESARIVKDGEATRSKMIEEAEGEVAAKAAELAELQGRVDRIAQALETR